MIFFPKLPEYITGLNATVPIYVTRGGLGQTTVIPSTGGPPPKDPREKPPSPLIPEQG